MAPAVIAALIGAAGSALAAGGTAAGTAINNRRSYQNSVDFYKFQNEYNLEHYSPEQNMARLQAAGINPHEVAGTPGSGMSVQGSPDVPKYQSPLGDIGNGITQALQMALSAYQIKKSLDNQSDLTQSQVNKNTADAAKTNFQVANLLPLEMAYQKNRVKIPLYQLGVMKLQQQKMLNEISLFSMQKQKMQLALDLMQLEKDFQGEYYQWRNKSVKYDALNKKNQYGITSLDLKNYQDFGLRPQDPYYTRIVANIVNSLSGGDTWLGRLLNRYLKP